MSTYIFIRKEGFYRVEALDDDAAKKMAEVNPGTLAVVNEATQQWIVGDPHAVEDAKFMEDKRN